MKTIRFYPVAPSGVNYRNLLLDRKKWTTTRLKEFDGDRYLKQLKLGDDVSITCGFDPEMVETVGQGKITRVLLKKMKEVTKQDLVGESPDAVTPQLLGVCMNQIYSPLIGREVTGEDF